MNALIKQTKLEGKIKILGSKSFAHRLLLGAFLSNKECEITNVPNSKDIEATLSCIKEMGGNFDFVDDKVEFYCPNDIDANKEITLNCLESGSTLRFLIPIALAKFNNVSFIGTEKLISRGIIEYEKIFKKQGIYYEINKNSILVKGKIKPDIFVINGDISSQYITGLLMALPNLNDDSIIRILPPINSKNYIDITLSILDLYQIKYEVNGNDIKVFGNQKYKPGYYEVEGDYSNAAFLKAFTYFDNNIEILGLNKHSLQGDKVYEELFEKLNKGYQEIDVSNCIDLCPILFVFAYLKNGAKFIGTQRLKYKESDRGEVIKEELKKLGAEIKIYDDYVIVNKNKGINTDNITFNTHNDHRICMALSLVSVYKKIRLLDIECVNKSYPDYFKDLKSLGGEIDYE